MPALACFTRNLSQDSEAWRVLGNVGNVNTRPEITHQWGGGGDWNPFELHSRFAVLALGVGGPVCLVELMLCLGLAPNEIVRRLHQYAPGVESLVCMEF